MCRCGGCGCCDPCWKCGIRPRSISIDGPRVMSGLNVPIHTFKRRFESDFDGNTVDPWDAPTASLFGGLRRAGKGFGPIFELFEPPGLGQPTERPEFYPSPQSQRAPGDKIGIRNVFPCVANFYEQGFKTLDHIVEDVDVELRWFPGSFETRRFEFRFALRSISVAVLLGYTFGPRQGSDGWLRERSARGSDAPGTSRLYVRVAEVYEIIYIDYLQGLLATRPNPGEYYGGFEAYGDGFVTPGAWVREELFYTDLPRPCRDFSGSIAVDELVRVVLTGPSLGGNLTPSTSFIQGSRSPDISDFNQIGSDTPRLTVTANF